MNKQKICLIIPPSVFLLDERVFLTIGILKVAAVLEQKEYKIDVLDLSGIENYENVVEEYIKNNETFIYGITATTPQIPSTIKIRNKIKEIRPDSKLILGGPHVTLTNAAVKMEKKANRLDRSHWAFEELKKNFDSLVCGDGEDAIFEVLNNNFPKVVDADDPKSDMFLTNKRLEELPWPARHLVDVDSYNYTIDGVKAIHIVAQLGCLTAETEITLSNGNVKPICELKEGEYVKSYDAKLNKFVNSPIKSVIYREANNLYELHTSGGKTIKVTGEHPIWTRNGWVTVDKLSEGDSIACLPTMRKSDNGKEILFQTMPVGMAKNSCQRKMDESGTISNKREISKHDKRRETTLLSSGKEQFTRINSRNSTEIVRYEKGRFEPNETSRSRTKSIGYNKREMVGLFIGKIKTTMEKWTNGLCVGAWRNKPTAEQIRDKSQCNFAENRTHISMGWKWGFLDWPMSIWEKTKSRFYKQTGEKNNSSSWGILASDGISNRGIERLSRKELESFNNLGQGIKNKEPKQSDNKDSIIFERIISKKFLGDSKVYNLTICPVHTYIANDIIVHNCPYLCAFCSGRNSPFLRKIRMRTSENIINEIEFLHNKYGFLGINFFDDELNVNPKILELMNGIKSLSDKIGKQFKLRGFVKSEIFKPEQAKAMYEAGFRWILTGFESGSDRILTNIKKRATKDENTKCFEIARNAGLKVKALMSIGHAGESEETINETKEWLLKVKPDDFDCTIITPYPGSPYYDSSIPYKDNKYVYTAENGDKLYSYWLDYTKTSDYYKGCPGSYKSYVFTDYLNENQLVTLRDNLESEVRNKLNIPFNQSKAAQKYEKSMGQSGPLPSFIFKTTEK